MASAERERVAIRALDRVLLSATGLKKSFGGDMVLRGVDVTLRRGECVLLTGENGSGKTSLINILTGNLIPDAGQVTYAATDESLATFEFPRPWWQSLVSTDGFRPERVARRGFGRSWQDVRLFKSLSLGENLAVAAADPKQEGFVHCVLAARHKIASPLFGLSHLGLAARASSRADKISLGQAKRVAIARAIEAGAKVLFLDEPLAGLDREGIRDVLQYLRMLSHRDAVTLVIVEHVFNQMHLLPLVTTRWLLTEGKCLCYSAESGERPTPPAAEVDRPQPAWLEALAVGARVSREALPRDAVLTRIGPVCADKRPPEILTVENVVAYCGNRAVLGIDDEAGLAPFNLNIRAGEIAVLEAPNGWGKTTLFNVIAGVSKPQRGRVLIAGQNCHAGRKARSAMSCVPSAAQLFPNLTLKEASAVAGQELPPRFHAMAQRRCATLSGGERQRLALGLAKPNALNMYDEPLNGLDSWHEFVASCRALAKQSCAVLILVPKQQS